MWDKHVWKGFESTICQKSTDNKEMRDFPSRRLELCASTAGSAGSAPDSGIQIPHATWPKKERKQLNDADNSDRAKEDAKSTPIIFLLPYLSSQHSGESF